MNHHTHLDDWSPEELAEIVKPVWMTMGHAGAIVCRRKGLCENCTGQVIMVAMQTLLARALVHGRLGLVFED